MNTITDSIKSAAVNNKVELKTALSIASKLDEEREKTIDLLKRLEKHVGMVLGEEINTHIAEMKGETFNVTAYHYEKPVGDQ